MFVVLLFICLLTLIAVRIGQWKAGVNPYLPSIGHSGMTVEVGPVPQGCLVPKIYHVSLPRI